MSGIIKDKWDMVSGTRSAGFFLETHDTGEWNACVFKTKDISGVIGG